MSNYSSMPAFMAATEYLPKKLKVMEKEMKIIVPEGHVVERIKIVDNMAIVTFRERERKLPESWDEFCEMFPIKKCERDDNLNRLPDCDKLCLPDHATAEAVLALYQLIQLRNAYNGDWVPDWDDTTEKYSIELYKNKITGDWVTGNYNIPSSPLFFKTEELRNKFLHHFRPLIEKIKPVYGII